MFGEKPLYGTVELKVDNHGRVYLPKYTQKEVNDELVLIYDEEIMKYEIYGIDKFNKIMEILGKYAIKSTIKSERLYYKRRICEISKSILKKLKVDNHGRISLGENYVNEDKVLCIGAYDHLIIEKIDSNNKER